MLKKLLALLVGIIILSFCNPVNAHGTFTWFGLRRNDTELIIQTSSPHTDCGHRDCHRPVPPPKPKKHKPKHEHPKKGPKPHKWWWHRD